MCTDPLSTSTICCTIWRDKISKEKCKCSVAVAFMEMQAQAFTCKHGRWSHYKQLRALALAYIGDEMGFGVTACPLFFI